MRYNRREKTGGQQSQVSLSAPKAEEPSTMPFAQRLTCTIEDACERSQHDWPHELGADAATNPYRVWIAAYAGVPYQEVAAKARAHMERLADLYATPAREAELTTIFKEATRLESDFWEMGWRAGQRVE